MGEQANFALPHQLPQFQLQFNNSLVDGQISSQRQPLPQPQQVVQSETSDSQMGGQISSQQQVAQTTSVKEIVLYKNQLQELLQKARLPLPVYHTVCVQEFPLLPQFRCTVEVDGEKFTSLNTSSTRKAAEQDAAKFALEALREKVKNCGFGNTTDKGFPPIHQDRLFSKSILNEFAAKKNLERPSYETVKMESVVPLFVSSLVFDGVKYTGEPSLNKKEAEQLVARAAILSILANSGVDTTLYKIVKSKANVINAVQEQCSSSTNVSHLPKSDTDAVKETVSENLQKRGDVTENITLVEPQQQSAGKKRRFLNNATVSCSLDGNTLPTTQQLQTHVPLEQELRIPNLETLPQPSLLPNYHVISQPAFSGSSQTLSQPSLLPSFQNFPQTTFSPNAQSHSQPSLVPCTQTLPQPSLLPNSHVVSQASLPSGSETPSELSLLPRSQANLQPNCLPVNSAPSDPQSKSRKAAARRRKKENKRANKMANNGIQMQPSIVSPSPGPPCTIAQ